jgi:hypothetical protein
VRIYFFCVRFLAAFADRFFCVRFLVPDDLRRLPPKSFGGCFPPSAAGVGAGAGVGASAAGAASCVAGAGVGAAGAGVGSCVADVPDPVIREVIPPILMKPRD